MEEKCPICHQISEKVKSITVKHLVSDNFLGEIVNEETYYLCMNENCDVVYYNLNNESILDKKKVKVPIWFKGDANPKYICYCNKVTEEQIINAVINQGAKNINDINKLTGAMKNGKCMLNNPLGKCCGPIVLQTIKRALQTNN
ncbi:(2Fe-2S)-binding protein [Tissierella sp. MSJ-40]|uniref:(2Fe-2S)-binding protein n=1 Tax=Tissierella simiarum TaxID=2841534 RepID=A0ABS6E0X3_9FIRM|nr:(2Fe-2S)-binding protein [Tissierella simiarum]MBU5436547.1 (2Fe-2S)-binding protein [Tissierella simiarum]